MKFALLDEYMKKHYGYTIDEIDKRLDYWRWSDDFASMLKSYTSYIHKLESMALLLELALKKHTACEPVIEILHQLASVHYLDEIKEIKCND